MVDSPAFHKLRDRGLNGPLSGNGAEFPTAETLTESLVDCLKDLLHAEGQLLKALPKMSRAARSTELTECFEQHLIEIESQVQRLKEVFKILGEKTMPTPCMGMVGLVEEGQEVITDGNEKEDLPADLALIAAAQKVEHYEISSYLSARALASQAGLSGGGTLLSQSLLEEERSDKLLGRIATVLMEEEAMADNEGTSEDTGTESQATAEEAEVAIEEEDDAKNLAKTRPRKRK
jgi:Mn-containing catalase